jgi:hypothetical protein
MCKAFSCVIGRDKKVIWKMGVDSHEDLLKIAGYKDDTRDPEIIEFARIESAPKNGSYLEPDKWVFKIDMDITPKWWTLAHKRACERAHKAWLKKLEKILVRKAIVNPLTLQPPEITPEILQLLKEWDSVRDSVWDSVKDSAWAAVGDSVWDSAWDSVRDSVWDSVKDSVWDSVGDSAWDSVRDSAWDSVRDSAWAYTGSFFVLPRKAWKYTEKIPGKEYPFKPAVTLWELGLVASFDGKIWRLHGGKDAKILWVGTAKDLEVT